MARTTSTAVPENAPDPDEVSAAETPEVDEPNPEWTHWRYTGPTGRIYTNVPVTPEPGDVVRWLGPPSPDGAWDATDDAVTRMPDNWRPEPEPEVVAPSTNPTPAD